MTSYLSTFFGKSNGKLAICLDDKYSVIRAGERLNGSIEIEVDKEVTGEELTLTLQGKEKAIKRRGPVEVSNQHEFFSLSIPVCDLRNVKLNAGTRSFPFSVELPSSLPSSAMHRLGLGDVGFNIQYKLTARMGVAAKTKLIAVAAATLERSTNFYIMHPTTQTIAKQGSITFAASVQETSIQKGDDIVVALSCRNDSHLKIQRVEIKVVELLNWGSKEGYSKSRLFKETLAVTGDVDLPGLQRENKSKLAIVDTTYRTVGAQKAMDDSIRDDLISGLNLFKLECPLRARDSYAGTLVDIRHYLKIKFVTNSYGNGSQPSIKIPLNVGLPDEIPSRIPVEAAPAPLIPENDNDMPIASPVSMSSSLAYDQRQKELAPMSPHKSSFQNGGGLVRADDPGDVELDLSHLVPMLPPTPSFE